MNLLRNSYNMSHNISGKGDGLPLSPVPPRFSSPLVDQGVQNGHPIKLSVKVRYLSK